MGAPRELIGCFADDSGFPAVAHVYVVVRCAKN